MFLHLFFKFSRFISITFSTCYKASFPFCLPVQRSFKLQQKPILFPCPGIFLLANSPYKIAALYHYGEYLMHNSSAMGKLNKVLISKEKGVMLCE